MCLTIAIGTMLLGGWVLDLPDENDQTSAAPQTQQQTQSQPQQTPAPAMLPPREQGRAAAGMAGSQGRMQAYSAGGMRPQQGQQQQQQAFMPSAPTESQSGADMMNQPAAPTSGFSNPTLSQRSPTAPTEYRSSLSDGGGFRPSSLSSRGSFSNASRPAPSGTASFMTPPAAAVSQATTAQEKAFAGYRAPSGVSPYMNLFRRDNGGTVDNYTTLVRPEAEQRFLNQRFGSDIRGLQNSTRSQGINLQNLNQQNRTLQGVGTPQYYMNYGNYYPGYGQ